ncbi:MAG: FlgD immunoglobulin-like domain containing protein, partial [Acidobacteriota bacterium]
MPGNESLLLYEGPGVAHAAYLAGSRRSFAEDLDRTAFSTTETGHFLTLAQPDPAGTSIIDVNYWVFRTLANLTADLRIRRAADGRTVILEGTAADANFRSYQLDYAPVDDPEDWRPVAPPANQPVVDGTFQPWLAPAEATWRVRLSVEDRAGNVRSIIRRVSTVEPAGIVDAYLTTDRFSPNGDGVLDTTTLRYRTLGPLQADFRIIDTDGQVLLTSTTPHLVAEEGSFTWDGRDRLGVPAPDGNYLISVEGWEFPVRVDTTAPSLDLHFYEPFEVLGDVVIREPLISAFAVRDRASEQLAADIERTLLGTDDWRSFIPLGELDPTEIEPIEFVDDVFIPGSREELQEYLAERNLTTEERISVLIAMSVELQRRIVWAGDELAPADAVGGEFRLVAEDEVGNRAVLTAPPLSEQVLLFDVGEPNLVNGQPVPGGVMVPPLLLATANAHPTGIAPTFELEGDLLYVHIKESVREPIVDVQLQFRDPGVDTWGSLGVSRFLIDGGEVVDPTQHDLDMLIDVGGLPGLSSKELRILTVDAVGVERASVRFRVANLGSCQPLAFRWVLETSEPELPESECYDRDAIRTTVSELLDEQGLDPTRQDVLWAIESVVPEIEETELFLRSEQDPDFAVPVLLRPIVERDGVMLFTTELDCARYEFDLKVTTEPVEVPATGSVEPLVFAIGGPVSNEDSCLAVGFDVVVQQAESCGVEPPGAAAVKMRAVGEGLEVLRLEDSSGRTVFSEVAPIEGTTYETEIDFDVEGLADGVHEYLLSASNSAGRTRSVPVKLPVDRTAPSLEFTAPAEGALVCADQVLVTNPAPDDRSKWIPTIYLRGQAQEDFPGTLTPQEREKLFSRTPAGEDTGLRPLFVRSTINLPIDFFARPDPLPSLDAADGGFAGDFRFPQYLEDVPGILDAEATLVAAGLGGHLVCSERTFQVDATVESASPSGPLYFSPNGDGTLDLASYALLAPLEPVTVDVDVFDDVEYDPGSTGFLSLGGDLPSCDISPLASPIVALGSALPVPGTPEVAWDGRSSGGASLADGLYGVRFISRDSCGNRKEEVLCVDLDTVPPVLEIDSPRAGVDLPTLITIRLTVFDPGDDPFSPFGIRNVTLDVGYGIGADPTVFFPIEGSVWNTFGLDAGTYTLRAVARDDAGNQTERRVTLELNPGDLITYLEAAPELFSPGADGVFDDTAARFGLDRDAATTLRIEGPGVAVTLIDEARTRGAHVVSWDGTDGAGSIVPDGTYSLVINATTPVDGGVLDQTERVDVVVDQTPPEHVIERPTVDGFLRTEDLVRATVTDAHLEEWTLSVAPDGAGSPAWRELARGGDGGAAATTQLDEGAWLLRLESRDQAGNRSETIVPFTVDATAPTADWTSPADSGVMGTASPIALTGVALDENLASVALEVGLGASPAAWTPIATIQAGDISSSGLFQTSWDASGLTDGVYTLRLLASDLAGYETERRRQIELDSTPPQVAITAPAAGGFVTGPVS